MIVITRQSYNYGAVQYIVFAIAVFYFFIYFIIILSI